MLSHRRDPYLWIHLAGLATVPLWLDVCLVGLAVGEPQVPPWLELIPLAAIGTVPILGMQWQRPFYIFSVPGLALRPDKLSLERRRLLTIQRGWLSRSLVLLTAIALLWALYTLYQAAPLAADLPWLAGESRTTGWVISAIAFFCANLFALVPATVVLLFLTNPARLEKVPPVEAPQILSKFTVAGLRLGKILPEPAAIAAPDAPANPSAPTAVGDAEDDSESSPPAASDDPVVTEEQLATTSEMTDAIAPAFEDAPTEVAAAADANATLSDSGVEPTSESVAEVETAAAAAPEISATAASETTADSSTAVETTAEGADTSTETPATTDAAASEPGTDSLNAPQTDGR